MADRYDDRRYEGREDAQTAPGAMEPGGAQQGDPLAELAKLIGQTDPFANFGRANPTHPLRRDRTHRASENGRVAEETDPYFDREIFDEAPPPPAWIQHRNEMLTGHEPIVEPDDVNSRPHPLRRFSAQQDGEASEPNAQYADGQYQDAHYGDDLPFQNTGYSNDPYAYGNDDADNPTAHEKSRRGLMTVAAVLGLAIVGTGGAFAYRTYVSSPRATAEVPVIKADPNPIKVVPPTTAEAANKAIQDRIGSATAETVVPREEQPVDIRDPSKAAARPNSGNFTARAPAAGVVPSAPSALTGPGEEPRRVRTFTVKGDQAEGAGSPPNAKQSPRAAAPTPPTPAPAPPRPQQEASRAPGPVANLATQNSSAPLSLNPRANLPAPPAPAQTSGGYVVQVSSQRSESDAHASYRSLQSKFPSVLGSRSATIKRADLGEKGIYYRAVLGPFGSAEDAAALCGNLKSAGGQCVVQRN